MAASTPPFDFSKRPFQAQAERVMAASPHVLFLAWTKNIDQWFAVPGSVKMEPQVNVPFSFEVEHEGKRYLHTGRFLKLEKDQRIELIWKTEATHGETLVQIELIPQELGTKLKLIHSGFSDEASMKRHEEAWPHVLAHLDEKTAPV